MSATLPWLHLKSFKGRQKLTFQVKYSWKKMVIDASVWGICKVSPTLGHVYTAQNSCVSFCVADGCWPVGAVEQKYGLVTVLSAQVLPSPHPGHLGGHSHDAAATQVTITVRTGLGVVV